MNCGTCGGVLEPTSSFCGDCGAAVDVAADGAREDSGRRDPVSATVPAPREGEVIGTTASGRAVLPGTPILLGDGEVIWRQYRAVRLRNRRRGQGTLFVTDARIVFYAWAKGRGAQRESALVQQVKLADVTGFSAFVSRRLSTLLLLLATAFTLAALGSLIAPSLLTAVFAIIAAICIALLFSELAQRGRAGVVITSRDASNSPVAFGGVGVRHPVLDIFVSLIFFPLQMVLRSFTTDDVLRGRPGDDSAQMIGELGALIMDLQTRGTFAAGHYGVGYEASPAQARELA